ncbi:MAG: glutathione S-transferase family protein [Polyangiaceae bacterium]
MSEKNVSLVLCELGETGIAGLQSFSPFCLKVHRALALARLPYTSRHASSPREHAKLNPAEQVPILLVDGKPVFDSTRILARIDELAPGALFAGLDARGWAEALLWEELADTALNGFLVAARWADDDNWPHVRDAYFGLAPWPVRKIIVPRIRARVMGSLHARDVTRHGLGECWTRFEGLLDVLDARAPDAGFWLGPKPTVADVSLFAQLASFRTRLTPRQEAMVRARARLSSYLDRVDVATTAGVASDRAETSPVTRARAA